MANGHPKIGNGSDVPYLDLGQIGGARHGAGDAKMSGSLTQGSVEVSDVRNVLTQQNVIIVDNLGFLGQTHRLHVIVRGKTVLDFITMMAELNQRRFGVYRDPVTGVQGVPTPAFQRAAPLTDFDGNIVAALVQIRNAAIVGRRSASQNWAAVARVVIDLEVIG